jgi:hypothetical protein
VTCGDVQVITNLNSIDEASAERLFATLTELTATAETLLNQKAAASKTSTATSSR